MNDHDQILDFVKALAHANRLKIVGMLAQKPKSMSEIAEGLSLSTREVFNHLAFLEYAGVVHKIDDGYELDTAGLENLARRQFKGGRFSQSPPPGMATGRQKVLAAFLNEDGTLRQVPNSRTQPEKFRIVLEHLLAAFEPGTSYTEKEVNSILRCFNHDVAGLRRDLIDIRILARERDGSRYWVCTGPTEMRPE